MALYLPEFAGCFPKQARAAELRLGRSKVHSWGLFAAKPIPAEEFVIEYVGELIRRTVNDVRERKDADSDYRFRVDEFWVVDATTRVRAFILLDANHANVSHCPRQFCGPGSHAFPCRSRTFAAGCSAVAAIGQAAHAQPACICWAILRNPAGFTD